MTISVDSGAIPAPAEPVYERLAMTSPAAVPTLPSAWNLQTVVTLIGSVATAILGIVVALAPVLPSGVSHEAQAILGSIITAVGTIVGPSILLVSKNSVQKTALAAGVEPHIAAKL